MGYFYQPLGDNYKKAEPFTYSNHGSGKLDFAIGEVPFYAITTGKIIECGAYSDGTLVITQECTNSNLGKTFYIRYLHGINDSSLDGTIVKAGTKLGLVGNNNGKYSNHLHIDFTWAANTFSPVFGTLNESERTWTCKGKAYKVADECDLSKAIEWAKTSGTPDRIGYCWLIFAMPSQNLDPIIPDSGEEGDISPTYANWSKKGQTSVPRYIQWYANSGNSYHPLSYRKKKMKEHGTLKYASSGDWADMPYNGGDVANNGCGACALANAMSGQLKKEITPDLTVALFNQNNVCTVWGGGLTACVNVLKNTSEYSDLNFEWLTLSKENMISFLERGGCIVFSNSTHYLCVYGTENGKFYISDSKVIGSGYSLDTLYSYEEVFVNNGFVQGPIGIIKK